VSNIKHKLTPNDKKRENFLIDLMDDSDSDNTESQKPKAWKRLRKGSVLDEPSNEVFDDPFPHP
jgi:hypothetical protein